MELSRKGSVKQLCARISLVNPLWAGRCRQEEEKVKTLGRGGKAPAEKATGLMLAFPDKAAVPNIHPYPGPCYLGTGPC